LDGDKAVVRRFITEVMNEGRLDVVDDLCARELAPATKAWITPFRSSFPDIHMEIVELIAEGTKVAGRFTCSGTHLGEWRGHPGSGRRFENVDEVYIFDLRDERIIDAWGLEDVQARIDQLGLD
jgi:predicted ester cyclase